MGFKEILQSLTRRNSDKKEMIKEIEDRVRAEEIVMEKRKSANQRELERYIKEENEKSIKAELEDMRKVRDADIRFNHNPLHTKNITKDVEWDVLKEKNQFSNSRNLFKGNKNIHKNNPNLLKNHSWLFS
jgi:hypothetical protein